MQELSRIMLLLDNMEGEYIDLLDSILQLLIEGGTPVNGLQFDR